MVEKKRMVMMMQIFLIRPTILDAQKKRQSANEFKNEHTDNLPIKRFYLVDGNRMEGKTC